MMRKHDRTMTEVMLRCTTSRDTALGCGVAVVSHPCKKPGGAAAAVRQATAISYSTCAKRKHHSQQSRSR
jgi:hypothetical protein